MWQQLACPLLSVDLNLSCIVYDLSGHVAATFLYYLNGNVAATCFFFIMG